MPCCRWLVSLGAFLSAFLGGWLALRAVRYVGLIIAIGAGIRIGAAFFDLIPEAVEYLGSLETAMLWTAIGFLAFYAIEQAHDAARRPRDGRRARPRRRVAPAHRCRRGRGHGHPQLPRRRRARGRSGRRRRDSRSSSPSVVIVHRFSDGIGVVSFLLAGRVPKHDRLSLADPRRRSRRSPASCWGSIITIPDEALGALLAFFAGFFLYVGAAELLPEAHRRDRSRWIVFATVGGAAAIYCFSSRSARSASTSAIDRRHVARHGTSSSDAMTIGEREA